MPFTTPNAQDSPTYAAQAVVDKTDLAALANFAQGYGVVSGCTVSAGSGYTVNVASGTILSANGRVTVSTVTGLAPSAASPSDRRDIVVASATGVVSIVSGTPTSETAVPWTTTSVYSPPVKPAIPASSTLLAEVYIPGSGATVLSSWITDKTLTTDITGPKWPTVTKTANYSALTSDSVILCNASSGAFTVTLPTAASVLGKLYTIKKIDTSANVVTVTTTSSQTIDGAITNIVATPYESVTVVSDNSNWSIV